MMVAMAAGADPAPPSAAAPAPHPSPADTAVSLVLPPVKPLAFSAPLAEALDEPPNLLVSPRATPHADGLTFRSRTDIYQSTDLPRSLPARVGQPIDLELRRAGSIELARGVRLEGVYTSFDTLGDATLGSIQMRTPTAGQRGPAGGVDVLEARLHLEAARAGPLTLELLGGIRATTMDYLPAYTPDVVPLNIEAEPIVGASLRWDVVRRLSIVGAAVASAADPEGIADLTVDARWRLSGSAELSVGYQLMRGTFEQQDISGDVKRDTVVVQLKLSF
ncbi:MAG: hypothetical protein ACKVS8_01865 [Phycisphaerales bacterium]